MLIIMLIMFHTQTLLIGLYLGDSNMNVYILAVSCHLSLLIVSMRIANIAILMLLLVV